jgi:hypothetical protein
MVAETALKLVAQVVQAAVAQEALLQQMVGLIRHLRKAMLAVQAVVKQKTYIADVAVAVAAQE